MVLGWYTIVYLSTGNVEGPITGILGNSPDTLEEVPAGSPGGVSRVRVRGLISSLGGGFQTFRGSTYRRVVSYPVPQTHGPGLDHYVAPSPS